MKLRFSIRTILAATTIIAIYFAISFTTAVNQRKAVEAIRKLGGSVEYDGSPDDLSGISKLAVSNLGVDWFFQVKIVFLSNLDLPKDSLKPLLHLPGVTNVNLRDTNVSDADLRDLSQLRQLSSIDLSESRLISDEGLQTLATHRSLEYIGLDRLYRMTDEGFACIANMPNIKSISSSDTEITDKAIESLRNPKLAKLTVLRCAVSPAAISSAKLCLPNLTIVGPWLSAADRAAIRNYGLTKRQRMQFQDSGPQ